MDSTRGYARVSHSRQWSNYNLYFVFIALVGRQQRRSAFKLLLQGFLGTRLSYLSYVVAKTVLYVIIITDSDGTDQNNSIKPVHSFGGVHVDDAIIARHDVFTAV